MDGQRKQAKNLNLWTNCLVSSAILGDSGHSCRVWSVTHVVHAEAKDVPTEERGEESESMDELSRQFCYTWGQWSFLQGVVSHSCCACRGPKMDGQRKEAKNLNLWTNYLVSSAILGDSGHFCRVWSVTHVVHAEAKDGRTEERGEELSRQFCYTWGQWSFLQGVVSHSCCACRGQRWTDRGKRRRV